MLAIGRECEAYQMLVEGLHWSSDSKHTIWVIKPIRDNGYSTSLGVQTVDLILQTRDGSEILNPAIDSVREIDIFALGMNCDVVQRVELPTKVVVEKDCCESVFALVRFPGG